MGKYDDIIGMSHHVSATRKPMTMEARAAQFAPFAALTGHEEAIRETGRVTEAKAELTGDELSRLSETLNHVIGMGRGVSVSITYFIPDRLKSGGRYVEVCGCVRKVDEYERIIALESGIAIPLDDVADIRIN